MYKPEIFHLRKATQESNKNVGGLKDNEDNCGVREGNPTVGQYITYK